MLRPRNSTPKDLFIAAVVGALLIGLGTFGYNFLSLNLTGPDDMRQGQRVIYQMMGEETLEHLGFFDLYADATPSQWVAYIDSRRGQVLWPPTTEEYRSDHTDPMREEIPGRLLRPTGLEYSAYEPDPALGRQLVYIPDDEEGVVHIHGYDEPFDEPVHTWVYEFPTDASFLDFETSTR